MQHYRICLDVDGIFANFVRAVCELFRRDPVKVFQGWEPGVYDITKALGIDDPKLWREIGLCRPASSWWIRVPAYEHAIGFLRAVDYFCEKLSDSEVKVEWVFLTSPCRTDGDECVAGKWNWIQDFISKAELIKPGKEWGDSRSFILTSKKYFCADANSILIDDHEGNCKLFKEHGGSSIVFPTWWNHRRHDAVQAPEHELQQYVTVYRELLHWAERQGLRPSLVPSWPFLSPLERPLGPKITVPGA